jgi:hypothetical protein
MQQAHCFSGPHKKCDSMRELIHRTLAGKEGKPLSPYSTCKYIACVLKLEFGHDCLAELYKAQHIA